MRHREAMTEIGDFQEEVFVEKDVLGFEVPMDDFLQGINCGNRV